MSDTDTTVATTATTDTPVQATPSTDTQTVVDTTAPAVTDTPAVVSTDVVSTTTTVPTATDTTASTPADASATTQADTTTAASSASPQVDTATTAPAVATPATTDSAPATVVADPAPVVTTTPEPIATPAPGKVVEQEQEHDHEEHRAEAHDQHDEKEHHGQSGVIAKDSSAAVGTVATATPAVATDSFAGTIFAGLVPDYFSSDLKDALNQILSTGTGLAKTTVSEVLAYVNTMGPSNRQDAKSGSTAQVSLYMSLINAINNGPSDFQLMWAVVLRIVYETKDRGAFNDRFAFRFFPDMPLDSDTRASFRALLTILITTSGVSGRSTALKQIDFQKALGKAFTDSGKSRLLSFYNV